MEERFKRPTTDELISFGILFMNDGGHVNMDKVAGAVAMCELILDRLHEHGHVNTKSAREIELEK